MIAQFEAASALHNAGQFNQAKDAYESIIAACPSHAEAMHNLGLLFVQHGMFADAAVWMQRATEANPLQPIYFSNYGNVLQDSGRWADAVPQYQKAIALDSKYADATYNLGNALQKINQHESAIEYYRRAIALNPMWAEAHLNCGNAYDVLGRYEEALQCYIKVTQCNPSYSGGYINLANVLVKLGRHAEAQAVHSQGAAMSSDPYLAYVAAGEFFLGNSKFIEAAERFELALKIKPMDPVVHQILGTTYFKIRDLNRAAGYFKKAIELKPDYADAYNGLAMALVKAGHFRDAEACFRKALEISPTFHIARVNLADAFFTEGNLQAALDNFKLLEPEIQPVGLMQFFKQQLGDWSNYDEDRANFLSRIRLTRLLGLTEDPWHVQRISDSPALAKEVAQSFFRTATNGDPVMALPAKRPKPKKIKIGYFSPDFRDHAVSHLALELFESHSRDKFETFAFAFGRAAPTDPMRLKIIKAFDHFIEINDKNDNDMVKMARELELDIAVDLAGITSEARLGIFVNRAAPVQVNFLGFTGTIGTNCHDYIIADPIVIPAGSEEHYTEKVARLPCMMPYDTRYNIFDKKPTRAEAGLPAEGIVFCSFNQCFKFTPEIFDSWMRILKQVPGSCLWLSRQRDSAMENFKRQASARGVDPARVIFAPRVGEMESHLARLQCADLFLDTFPYNAHTSAVDSLWAGVPLITRMGDSFASRLAGSLISSLGLSDLIVPDVAAYEALAVNLATHPEKIAVLKQRLAQGRPASSVFNPTIYRKNYESALMQMHERYHADLPPDHLRTF
jgi:predicted O-linked N-acetylglucosamine transferase (SPINDLY family)